MSRSPRSHARELVLQGLYALEVGGGSPDDIAVKVISEDGLDENSLVFARHLFDAVRQNRDWADRTISALARNWRLERIAVIDQIVLRMAMTELKVMPDVPVKVVLNEAIELVKLYSTADSSAFINGILDSFIKNLSVTDSV
ncbi:MAG: transcription antitermination factor NusB [Candidatus Zixiibacteriota bacterium]